MKLTTVVKTFRVLEAMSEADEPQQLRALALATGLPKPTAHHILKTLTELGYVERMADAAYRKTSKIERLAMNGTKRLLTNAAEPILQELYQQTGETVNLGALRHREVIYLRVLESAHPLRRVVTNLTSCSFHCAALGRVQAAFLPEAVQQELLTVQPFESLTPSTVIDVNELRGILEQVKRDGYAIEREESELGVMCIAAPVFRQESVCAAVSISAPTARVDDNVEKQLIQQVCDAAEQLTRRLDEPSAH